MRAGNTGLANAANSLPTSNIAILAWATMPRDANRFTLSSIDLG
jgi:hypothetical protein